MSFQSLNKDELNEVAEFFVVDIIAADSEKGPSKNELIAALASGSEPVSWDDYKEVYLASKEKSVDKPVVAPVETVVEEAPVASKSDVTENLVLVKMERRNNTYEVAGHVFTKAHPFASVSEDAAKYLVQKVKGFRLALSSEVTDYYN